MYSERPQPGRCLRAESEESVGDKLCRKRPRAEPRSTTPTTIPDLERELHVPSGRRILNVTVARRSIWLRSF